jgi:hypothetical protein
MIDRSIVPAPSSIRPFQFPRVQHTTLKNDLTLLSAEQRGVAMRRA